MREAFKQLQINERRRTFAECEYWLNQYKLFAEQVLQALAAEPEPAVGINGLTEEQTEQTASVFGLTNRKPEPAGEPVAVEFIADLQRSRSKHPGIKKMFDGLLGEVHELKRAYQGDGDIRAEAFDVAVCAYRIATEGDEGENQKIDFVPDWMAWGAASPTPEAVRKLVDEAEAAIKFIGDLPVKVRECNGGVRFARRHEASVAGC